MKLIGIGDSVVDYYQDQGLIYPGGNAFNVGVLAKRNGAQACAYLGMIGNDKAADLIIHAASLEEIDMTRVRRVFGPTGEAVVSLNEEGDRVFVGTNRGKRVQSLLKLQLTEEDLDYIRTYDLIHTSVNSDIEHELIRLAGQPISYDFSTPKRWTRAYLEQVCPYLTYAFFSGSEMELEDIERLIEEVHGWGVQVVGVTRGAQSAIFSEKGERFEQSPMPAQVVDTMGAGDSFIAGFLVSYHDHQDMRKALLQAAQSAAQTCQTYGAFGYGTKK
ncbi:PfkB family carbohydrate kinase [Ammoniphilus sp. YIM 78166]|uniref:PfkB family carbohydrate kinase n=1 Tax=Ammoniphilus sp. YIM 78166 TaxID=1644106 RepID=UPI00106FBEDD|nr:PfkB family carbohydrate kinase [Ammoniphilus sp. YIM 78166]